MGKVAVIHPDLGVGGAERLIVDISRALQDCGHDVRIYTGYHDTKHCFTETKDGTLKVSTIGSWIPRAIFGKCHALLAYIKMIYISLHLLLISNHDLVVCDQVSACIPFLKLGKSRIIFYCHFPDQLLTTRQTYLKTLYRRPLDYYEEISTRAADVILVNSKFTSSVVKKTFSSLKQRELGVLYPCINLKSMQHEGLTLDYRGEEPFDRCYKAYQEENYIFLSINRFERKKNLELAILSLKECLAGQLMKAHLIVAGGYDERLLDSVQYYKELTDLVEKLNLNSYVTFYKSPSCDAKLLLFLMSSAVIYTPENEHFGIVPLEAMAMARPVIATATGGPLETVDSETSGILCECDKYSFADAMLRLYSDRQLSKRMGAAGLKRVKEQFSYESFRDKINKICYPQAN